MATITDPRQLRLIRNGGLALSDYWSGDLRSSILSLLAANTDESQSTRIILPFGVHTLSENLEDTDGLRGNIVFDGVDRDLCEIQDDAAYVGSVRMIRWLNDAVVNRNIVFRNITFRILKENDPFSQFITVVNGQNVRIERCRFIVNQPDAGGTRAAVILRGSELSIEDCEFVGSQASMGGLGESSKNCRFIKNLCKFPNDLALSVVSGDAPSLTLEGIHIADNLIYSMRGGGGLYVGDDSDGTTPPVLMRDVNICNNTLVGPVDENSSQIKVGVQVAFAEVTESVNISNNVITCTNPHALSDDNNGIRIFARDLSAFVSASDITVLDNIVDLNLTNADYQMEIWAGNSCDVAGLRVAGNHIRGGRGIFLRNCGECVLDGNRVVNATEAALIVGSTGVACTTKVRNCHFETIASPATPAIKLQGDQDLDVDVWHSTFVSSGFHIEDNTTSGTTTYTENFVNRVGVGTSEKTPDRCGLGNQSDIAPTSAQTLTHDPGAGNVDLTVCPANHSPGLYRVSIYWDIVSATTLGTAAVDIHYNDNGGAKVVTVQAGVPTGTAGVQVAPDRAIHSDGTAPIRVVWTYSGVTGPVGDVDHYAAAASAEPI